MSDPLAGELPPREAWAEHARASATQALSVSRWLVGVIGAALAASLASVQLSGIGRYGLDDARLWVATGGAVTALCGFSYCLAAVLRVKSDEIDLQKLTPDEMSLAHEWQFMLGYKSGEEFYKKRQVLLAIWDDINEPGRVDLVLPPSWTVEDRRTYLRRELTGMAWTVHDLIALIESDRILKAYGAAKRALLIGGFVAASGVLVVAWATGEPETTTAPPAQMSTSTPGA